MNDAVLLRITDVSGEKLPKKVIDFIQSNYQSEGDIVTVDKDKKQVHIEYKPTNINLKLFDIIPNLKSGLVAKYSSEIDMFNKITIYVSQNNKWNFIISYHQEIFRQSDGDDFDKIAMKARKDAGDNEDIFNALHQLSNIYFNTSILSKLNINTKGN